MALLLRFPISNTRGMRRGSGDGEDGMHAYCSTGPASPDSGK